MTPDGGGPHVGPLATEGQADPGQINPKGVAMNWHRNGRFGLIGFVPAGDDVCGKSLAKWPYGNCTERSGHAGDCDRRQRTPYRPVRTRVAAKRVKERTGSVEYIAARTDDTAIVSAIPRVGE